MARRKKSAEFDEHTKHKAKRKWHRDNPGRENQDLHVHHRVSREWGRRNGVPNSLLSSRNNAEAMTPEQHKRHHRKEPSDKEYRSLAQALFGWIGGLFD